MNKILIHNCLRCGHEWPSKQEHPRVCPKCHNPTIKKKIHRYVFFISGNCGFRVLPPSHSKKVYHLCLQRNQKYISAKSVNDGLKNALIEMLTIAGP